MHTDVLAVNSTAAELPPPYTCTNGKGGLWANGKYPQACIPRDELRGVSMSADAFMQNPICTPDVYEIIGRKADFQEYPDDEM